MLIGQNIDRSLIVDENVDVTFGFLLSVKERMAGPLTKPVPERRLTRSDRVGVLSEIDTGRQVWQVFTSRNQTDSERRAFWDGVNNLTLRRRNEATKGVNERGGDEGWFGSLGFDVMEKLAIGLAVIVLLVGLVSRAIPTAFGL